MRLEIILFIISLIPLSAIGEDLKVNAHIRSQAASMYQAAKTSGPRFSLIGELKQGVKTPYSINGEDFSIATDALTMGSLSLGKTVKVRGLISDGKKIAKKVLVSSDNSPSQRTASSDGSDAKD